jgi:FkbM family methyltransferase
MVPPIPPFRTRLATKWRDFRGYVSAFGFGPATILLLGELSARVQRRFPTVGFPSLTIPLRIRLLKHPFRLRLFTSDVWVVRQTLYERHYRDIEAAGGNGLVIDLGANIGSYAALVLSRHHDTRVLCVEPDPETAEVARRNLAPYGPRAEVLPTAIWDRPAGLRIKRYGAGLEWSIHVRPCEDGETPDITAVTMDQILEREGRDRIDVLKIDIEGAEEQLFAGNVPWLDRVDLVAVELHGPQARGAVERALEPGGWKHDRRGEIDLFTRQPGQTLAEA